MLSSRDALVAQYIFSKMIQRRAERSCSLATASSFNLQTSFYPGKTTRSVSPSSLVILIVEIENAVSADRVKAPTSASSGINVGKVGTGVNVWFPANPVMHASPD